MERTHHYSLTTVWTGNRGSGTSHYTAYDRSHQIDIAGKAPLLCSSDMAFRGDASLHNPEDLLLASLSACHMLWYLHLCADAGIRVLTYRDQASGAMEQREKGGAFTAVLLQPEVVVAAGSDLAKAATLHEDAHQHCFIANSVNFPVRHKPIIREDRD